MKIYIFFAAALFLGSSVARAEGVNCLSVAQAVAGTQSQGNLADYSDEVLRQMGGPQGDALIALRKKAAAEKRAVQDVPFSSRGKSAEELAERVWKIAVTSCSKELRAKVEEVVASYRKCRSGADSVSSGLPGVAAQATKRLPVEISEAAPVDPTAAPGK